MELFSFKSYDGEEGKDEELWSEILSKIQHCTRRESIKQNDIHIDSSVLLSILAYERADCFCTRLFEMDENMA